MINGLRRWRREHGCEEIPTDGGRKEDHPSGPGLAWTRHPDNRMNATSYFISLSNKHMVVTCLEGKGRTVLRIPSFRPSSLFNCLYVYMLVLLSYIWFELVIAEFPRSGIQYRQWYFGTLSKYFENISPIEPFPFATPVLTSIMTGRPHVV